MFAALILSLSLQAAPDALEPERCLRTLQMLDARVNRSARVDWRHVAEVQKIAAVHGHMYRHGGWPPGMAAPRAPAEQAEEIRREAEAASVADLSLRLDWCLVRYPISRDDD